MMNETHFHVVVIGSGFGGLVMTYRLAEAGLPSREGESVSARFVSSQPVPNEEKLLGS